MDITVENKRGR